MNQCDSIGKSERSSVQLMVIIIFQAFLIMQNNLYIIWQPAFPHKNTTFIAFRLHMERLHRTPCYTDVFIFSQFNQKNVCVHIDPLGQGGGGSGD